MRILFAIAVVLAGAVSSGMESPYRWPLDRPRKLSSSFGEFREGHYHAGIDLRTFGLIGLPCIAVADCDAVRLRVSPTGYGKAAYFRLDDGTTVVYAHLNGFSRALDSLSYYWRLERGRSSFDLDIPPGAFRFRAGDTIAYTGTTGSPHPHLHFEMRDTRGRPINPLESIYTAPDECPPVITALEAVPLSWGSLVDGSPVTRQFHPRLGAGGRYVLDDTLELDGRFGFGVIAYDQQTRGSYRMAPYSIALAVDGREVYRVRNSMFDYAEAGDIALEYEERGGSVPGRYLLLFRKSGNRLPGRDGAGEVAIDSFRAGAPAVGRGIHLGEITVRDAAANEARAIFHFTLNRCPALEVSLAALDSSRVSIVSCDPEGGSVSTSLFVSRDEGTTWNPVALEPSANGREAPIQKDGGSLYRCIVRDEGGATAEKYFAFPTPRAGGGAVRCECAEELRAEGLYLKVEVDHPLAGPPSIRRAGVAGGDPLEVFATGLRDYLAFVPMENLRSGLNLFSIRGSDSRGYVLDCPCSCFLCVFESGGSASFNASDSLEIRFSAPATRGRSALLVRQTANPGRAPAELVRLAPPFILDFPAEGYSRPLLCGFTGGSRAGLFRWEGARERWRCVGVPRGAGGMVEVRRSGTYAIFEDVGAPVIRVPSFTRVNPGSGFFKSHLHYLSVREEGSGVDAESAVVTLNGGKAVCEWDGYRKRLAIPLPRTYPPGVCRLRVELADLAGNRSSREETIVIE
jgi:hypothetical protein